MIPRPRRDWIAAARTRPTPETSLLMWRAGLVMRGSLAEEG